jgi:formylglycine-generating enzyme required for sulfatase activity
MRLLLCLARAVVKNGFKILAEAVPFGGALYDVAADAWQEYREKRPENQAAKTKPEASLAADLQALAQASAAQVRQEAVAAAQQAAPDQPQIQQALTAYLTQVPAMIRRSLRRPSDPTGTTIPPAWAPRRPEDLLSFLPPKAPRFKPGDRPLPGVNWELEELLGVGGFGEVWKARHPSLTGITAALKFCLDAQAGTSLRHEAAALNRLMQAGRHPGIVPLRQAYLGRDPICLEYEFVEGGDLCGLIRELHQRGKVAPNAVARWMLHLVATVRFAHQMQPPLVHRDLKPANILVQRGPDGRFSLRIADFGISGLAASQALDAAARTSTSCNSLLTTAVRGACTPLYASPQQQRGEPADPRDDVHALGVIWYQMLTGDLSQGLPADWREELSERGVPGPMLDLLARCVAGHPERRLADAAELTRQLESLLKTSEVRKPPGSTPRPDAAAAALTAQVERSAEHIRQAHAEFTNSIGMKFVLIPAGKFLMGSPRTAEERRALIRGTTDEHPREAEVLQAYEAMYEARYGPWKWPADEHQHEVEIAHPFYLGVHPVTVSNFRVYCQCMGYKTEAERSGRAFRWTGGTLVPDPSTNWQNPGWKQTDDHPVTCVTWNDAQAFCTWISRIEKEHLYRLPTEAEWEYACRAGTTTPFSFGKAGKAEEYAWLEDNSGNGPHPVGTRRPNVWGLFDMQGNVMEWCQDWYDENYYNQSPRQDPQGPTNGSDRVARGASWIEDSVCCRSANRHRAGPSNSSVILGFRVVCVVPGMLNPQRATSR